MIPIAKPLIGQEEKDAVMKVLDSGMMASGPKVREFEEAFAAANGVKHAIATASGTTALHAAMLCAGVGRGDEVITTAFTFIATPNSILMCGAKPVLADIDPRTFNMDPLKIEARITPKTGAILPVHLYGQPADMDAILKIADRHGLKVIGDACQAHGSAYKGKKVGGLSHAECFSMYPTKNMTSSEGGMITTDDGGLADMARSVINHGRGQLALGTYDHVRLGYNYRTTDIAAAIGLEQLKKLGGFNKRRRENAAYLDDALEGVKGVEVPFVLGGAEHVYHQYTIRVEDRASLQARLRENGIGFGVYYPKAVHEYVHLTQYGHDDLKEAEHAGREALSLPVHPSLTEEDLSKIAGTIREWAEKQ
ncbi:MAG: aminotransferase DegT [Thermoplasmata archaeon HGW-Thermoplasmata-1]|nr:MAG: aminotransferase DegT [Thermoplasmata archaeon HGW-Thermoplasmata-1]